MAFGCNGFDLIDLNTKNYNTERDGTGNIA